MSIWENSFFVLNVVYLLFVVCDCFQVVNDSVARKSVRTATKETGMDVDFVNAEVKVTCLFYSLVQ